MCSLFLFWQMGLDILCEYTDPSHIANAMGALKGKPSSMVIYYLKLRHNLMPKLQGFIFLGLEISHLTIHNSSLAVVEETSLSSIGGTKSYRLVVERSFRDSLKLNPKNSMVFFFFLLQETV